MAVVYSYIRFSTKKQLEGDSLRRQVDDGEAWISRNGHKLADMKLRDLGVSAFRGRNKHAGALSTFLDGIRSGRVQPGSILLVENLDRLSREGMSEAKKVFEQILEAGVLIAVLRPYERVFTKESVSDPFGLMEPLMAFHLSFIESKNKADRLRKLWDRKRADAVKTGPGYVFDHRCPSWVSWDKEKKAFVLNDNAPATGGTRGVPRTTIRSQPSQALLARSFPEWKYSFLAIRSDQKASSLSSSAIWQ